MKPGDRVGRYVVEGLLGVGGMGEVYRAYDEMLHRRVAVKLLKAQGGPGGAGQGSQGTVRRILREARSAAALDHPNVVAIFDVGEHEGVPFIVMELVNGRSLRALIASDANVAERLRWLIDVARALQAAHRAGLTHRDVKPENVLVRDDGGVKVLDFGIARRADAGGEEAARHSPRGDGDARVVAPTAAALPEATPMQTSTFAGTPAYMAPESIRGASSDPRVDQFAWGVMAYEVLSGRLPWTAQGAMLLQAILEETPEPLDAAAIGVGPDVVRAVTRAMEKTPEARFESMEALLASMGASAGVDTGRVVRAAVEANELGSAPTVLLVESTAALSTAARTRKKRPPTRVLAASAAAVCAAGLVAYGLSRPAKVVPTSGAKVAEAGGAAFSFRPSDPRRLTFDLGCEEFPSLRPDGDAVVYDGTFGDDSHLVLLPLDGGAPRTITSDPGWQFAAQVSPDGTRAVYLQMAHEKAAAYVVALDGTAKPIFVREGETRPSWTPDGKAVWAGYDGSPERVDVATGKTTRTLTASEGNLLTMVLELPDGHLFARRWDKSTHRNGGQAIVRYDPGASAPVEVYVGDVDEALALAPDGAHVLFARELDDAKRELWQAPVDGGAASPTGDSVVAPTKGVTLSRRGDRVVWSSCTGGVELAPLDDASGKRLPRIEAMFSHADWSDSDPAGVPGGGERLVVTSDRGGHPALWVLDAAGKDAPRELPTAGVTPAESAVSPDARWVAFTAVDKGIWVVPLDGSAPARALTTRATDCHPAFASDARTVYFATGAGADAGGSGGKGSIASVPIDGGAPVVLIEGARLPAGSPTAPEIAYVTDEAAGETRVYDLTKRTSVPLAAGLEKGIHSVRYSLDGKRLLVLNGITELVELDARTRTPRRTFTTGDQILTATYAGSRVIIARSVWRGHLWTARLPVGP